MVQGTRSFWSVVAVSIALASPSCAARSPDITIEFRVDQEMYRPGYLLLTWLAPEDRDHVGVRFPGGGELTANGPSLGSFVIHMDGAPAGERSIVVWGMRGMTQVSGASSRLLWVPGSPQDIVLTLGCMTAKDRIPPPLAGLVDLAAWVPCDAPAPPGVDGPPADVSRDAASDVVEIVQPIPDPSPPDLAPQTDIVPVAADAAREQDAAPPPPPDRGVPEPGGPPRAPPDAGAPDSPPDVRPSRDASADSPRDLPRREALPPGADLSNGLIAYLKFDDGTGIAARDSSGNGNNGTLQRLNAATAWVSGYLGTAVDIAGTGLVAIEQSVGLNSLSNGFTISAWVNRTGDGTIAARRSVGGLGFLYRFFITGGRLGLQINSSNGARADFLGANVVPTGQWVHVAAVYDQLNARVFLGGVTNGEQRYELPVGPENSAFVLGASEGATADATADHLFGQIDEVAVYNRALSAVEVAAVAQGYLPPVR
jgi:Concanavalin A-like lectin/glucanases superfamily